MQEGSSTCLDLCPTGFTDWNTTDNQCNGGPTGEVFKVNLSKWQKDFKAVTESISDENILQLGDTQDYGTDDPWLDREVNFFSI